MDSSALNPPAHAAMDLIRAGGEGFEGLHPLAGVQCMHEDSHLDVQGTGLHAAQRLAEVGPARVRFLTPSGGVGAFCLLDERWLEVAPTGASLGEPCRWAQLPRAATVNGLGYRLVGQAGRHIIPTVDCRCIDLPLAVARALALDFQSGAYGASASPQAFLGHPTVTEVLV